MLYFSFILVLNNLWEFYIVSDRWRCEYVSKIYILSETFQLFNRAKQAEDFDTRWQKRTNFKDHHENLGVCIAVSIIQAVQYSTVHCTVKYSTVQYSTAQYSTVQYSTVQYSTAQYNTVQYSTVQHSTVQYSTVQHSTAQHSSVQNRTVQYSIVQHSTAQHSTITLF